MNGYKEHSNLVELISNLLEYYYQCLLAKAHLEHTCT